MDTQEFLHKQLLDRKSRLLTAMKRGKSNQVAALLHDVDSALERMRMGPSVCVRHATTPSSRNVFLSTPLPGTASIT